MLTIEIPTAQKVTIAYEVAPLRDRMLAFLIDMVIIALGGYILFIVTQTIVGYTISWYFSLVIVGPVTMLYTLISELLMNGQSIGKRALQIKVIKLTGTEMGSSDYAIRWVLRLIDIWLSAGTIASLLISASGKGQRLGDLLSNTVVVKLYPTRRIGLSDILKINTAETYQPQFPQVRQLTEQDMLFVKNVIDRYRRYPNDAHIDALNELTQRLCEILNIQPHPTDKINFLRTLLNDYVVLTR